LSEQDIYVCGTNGTIFHCSGRDWTPVQSGTRQHLQAIHCVSSTEIWIVGGNGTLLRGNAMTGFKRVGIPSIDTNLWSVRKHEDVVYLGGTDGLYRMFGDKSEQVWPDVEGLPSQFTVQAIDSTDSTLWVVADRFVLRNHANKWQLFMHPDNE
jgi:hypothetical protein